MSSEIELKLRVDEFESVRAALRAAGGQYIGRGLEENLFFDSPDQRLNRAGMGLRLRTFQSDDGSARASILTVKGTGGSAEIKRRDEVETRVDDAQATERLLNLLGFTRVLRYEKRRESWSLDECRVELDEPPHIGLFVEIEGPDEQGIRAVQARIGLGAAAAATSTYVAMMAAYCKQQELAPCDVRFTIARRII